MRKPRPFAAVLLALACGIPQAPAMAAGLLDAYPSGDAGYPLSHPRVSAEGRLILDADPDFEGSLLQLKRAGWAWQACRNWLGAIRSSGAMADPSLVVLSPRGGELWECKADHAELLVEWDDTRTPLTGPANQSGNFYLSVAGQASLGGAATAYGFNSAAGISLYANRFDLALTLGLVNLNSTMTTGLLLRERFPVNPGFGINFGLEPQLSLAALSVPANSTSTLSSLSTSFSVAFLAGVSFGVPSGTIDGTVSVATNGAYSLLAGHTFFFNMR